MRAALVHRGPDEGSADAFGAACSGTSGCGCSTSRRATSRSRTRRRRRRGLQRRALQLPRAARRAGARPRGARHRRHAVIPHLYEEHGVEFVERLHGMFALALWDAPRERLVLARDRLGKKPLLWTRLAGRHARVRVRAEGAAAAPVLPRELDLAAIDAYLALQYVPGPRTALRGVRSSRPGHVLVAEAGASGSSGTGGRAEPDGRVATTSGSSACARRSARRCAAARRRRPARRAPLRRDRLERSSSR